MQTFRYQGLSSSGARIDGVVDAIDEHEAVIKAKASCKVVIKVEKQSKKNLLTANVSDLFGGPKIKAKALSLLCSQLSIELRAGLPLVRALELVAENEPDKELKEILAKTAEDVGSGHTLAESFASNGPTLPPTFIETIRAGEESGTLDQCFTRLRDYYKNSSAVASKVTSAMIYPIMLIIVAIVVVAIIMIKAVPVFEDSFASMDLELPWVTRSLIAVSNFMTDNFLILVVIFALIFISVMLFGKTETGKSLYARIALTFPGIGLVNRMNAASQFSATMGTMLAAGLPMLQATQITSRIMSNYLIKTDVRHAAEGIVTGQRLVDGLRKSKWLPSLLLEMTGVGEETGNLDDTLDVINEYYTDEVSVAVARALSILEPCITLVMAGLVVFILLSVYLPLFSMYGSF